MTTAIECKNWSQPRLDAYRKALDEIVENAADDTVKLYRNNQWQNGRGMLLLLLKDGDVFSIFLARALGDSPTWVFQNENSARAAFDDAVKTAEKNCNCSEVAAVIEQAVGGH
jgi:hypothetical protein